MSITIVEATNPVQPLHHAAVHQLDTATTPAAWFEAECRFAAMPVVAVRNGEPLLRAEGEWDRPLEDGDILVFVPLPGDGGGGGSDPLRVALMIGLAIAAPYVGAWATLAWEGSVAGAMIAGSVATSLTMAVGTTLINAALPPPEPPRAASSAIERSPTYSLQPSGNQARLLQPIPVIYGRHRVYPDLAAQPYWEYSGDDQYVYQLLCLGQGEYDIEAVRIEDTDISAYPGATYEIVPPGGTVTKFPDNVVTSVEVSGQELLAPNEGGDYLGPFVAVPSGEQATYIGIDLVATGLFVAQDDGSLGIIQADTVVEAREIDDAGNPVGDGTWVQLGTPFLRGATYDTIRHSYKYPVTPGRYEVRVKRTNDANTDSRAQDSIYWGGLRAYMPDVGQYGDVTMIAVVLKATNEISQSAASKLNVICTRRLPTWHPTTGWSAPQPTRNPAWAIADILRAQYGAREADARIDLQALYELSQTWAARGDEFNAVFDSRTNILEALRLVARVGRAIPTRTGGVVGCVRDEPRTVRTAMFSPRNMIRGSFSVEYLYPPENRHDAISVEYFDSETWQWSEVTAVLPGEAGTNPARVRLFGCTNRDQAWREGMYMAAADRDRRILPTFRTELEGHIPELLDLVTVSHDLPQWGYSGQVEAWDAATLRMTTSEPLIWRDGVQHYVALRRRDGSLSGPWAVTPGAHDREMVFAQAPDMTPYTGDSEERTLYQFGPSEAYAMECRVVAIIPRSDLQVEMWLVRESDSVHTADQGVAPPPPPASQLPGVGDAPSVIGLVVNEGGTPDAPVLYASWYPSPGATEYIIETSTDGDKWTGWGSVASNSAEIPVQPGTRWLRVAAVGLVQGPWATWSGDAGAGVKPPAVVTGLAVDGPVPGQFGGDECRIVWQPAARAISYTVEVWSWSQMMRTTTVYDTRYSYTLSDSIADGGPSRNIEFRVRANGGGGQVSPSDAVLQATNPQIPAVTGVVAVAGPGTITVRCNPPLDEDLAGYIVWMSTTQGFAPDDSNQVYLGTENPVTIQTPDDTSTYYLRMAAYDRWGRDVVNASAEVSATPKPLAEPILSVTPAYVRLDYDSATPTSVTFSATVTLDGVDDTSSWTFEWEYGGAVVSTASSATVAKADMPYGFSSLVCTATNGTTTLTEMAQIEHVRFFDGTQPLVVSDAVTA